MKPKSFMLIAGETSGDLLAAELVRCLRQELAKIAPVPTQDYQPLKTTLEPLFFGAGGPAMKEAGVQLAFDMTRHSVIGLSEVLKNLLKFRRLFNQLYHLALAKQPDVILCVDFSGFNRRFGHAIKTYVRSHQDWFHDWRPKLVQYVSPQVWASREGRAYQIASDFDLLLSIFPFEKDWYARTVPELPVKFVGNPIVDRYSELGLGTASAPNPFTDIAEDKVAPTPVIATIGCKREGSSSSKVLLLPGSRSGELNRHLPVILRAWDKMGKVRADLTAMMVLPNDSLADQARPFTQTSGVTIQTGGLADALKQAGLAIASTGTVTMECAYFGVPTVALYKTSWFNYQVGKRVVKVKYLGMPNLLADEPIFPEFIQSAATPENIARAALGLLDDPKRQTYVRSRLAQIVSALGSPGASRRAAQAIIEMITAKC